MNILYMLAGAICILGIPVILAVLFAQNITTYIALALLIPALFFILKIKDMESIQIKSIFFIVSILCLITAIYCLNTSIVDATNLFKSLHNIKN